MPNAIPRVEPSGRDVRGELAIPDDAPVVATVCQLRPEKALELLVDAAAIVRAEFPALRVLIAGDGQEETRLRAQIEMLGLGDVVILLGTRRDVPDVLAAADVTVCCSDFEGTPLSVMEYMAAGKPVVASRVGGLPELVEHGVHGLLFERRNVDEFATALATLLRDPNRRRQMGRAARARQQAHFDLDSTVRRLEELYEVMYLHTKRGRREGWRPLPRPASARG
jgi:glycosyltransferase involved in cell wall biosynthesis